MNNDIIKLSHSDFKVKTIDAKIDPKLIGALTRTINAASPQYNHYAPQPEYEIIGLDLAVGEQDISTSTLTSPIADLEKIVETACSHGHYDYDEYMYGMANGLILALATMKNEEPNYLDRPEKWLCDMDAPRPSLTDDTAKSCPEQEEDVKANGFMSRRFVLRRYLQMSDEEIALANDEIALSCKAIELEDDLNAQRKMSDIIQSCAIQDKPVPKPADADMEEAASLMADKMRDFVDNEILEELKLLGEEQATDDYERSMKGL